MFGRQDFCAMRMWISICSHQVLDLFGLKAEIDSRLMCLESKNNLFSVILNYWTKK